MTSFTHFYRNSLFARVSINLVIFLLVYLAVVRPLRMQVTSKVVHPMLSTLFSGSSELPIISDGTLEWLRFQDINGLIAVITPFGVVWGIPFTLLASTRNWKFAKMLTYYHVTVTFILPILLSLFFMRWVWLLLPTDINIYLSRVLGMSFCLFAMKGLYNDHCRIRKNFGVSAGKRNSP
jgi:hypothetical protein|tara:strand:- start:479 stop:1015 length:537 start_codon:yes stop_codon:yes gene_type:complete